MEFERSAPSERVLVPQFASILGESLLPPSIQKERILTGEEFEAEYPVRAMLYAEFSTLRSDFSKEALQKIKILGKYLHMLNRADEYIKRHENGEITLWSEQFNAFKKIRDGLEKGETDGRVKMPTSSGKTVLFTEFVEAIGIKTTKGDDFKTLIVVPDQKPVKQTKEKMTKFAPNLPVGVVYGNKKDIGEKEQPVTVITDESLNIQLKKGTINPLNYDLLVLDEADVYLTPPKQQDIARFANATRLGFSATMEYGPEKKVEDYLPHEHYSLEIVEAVHKDQISPFSIIIAETTSDLTGVRIWGNEYKEDDLARVLDIETRNTSAIELYKKMFDGKSAVAYCIGVNHARRLAEKLNENGVSAEYISGYMSEAERDGIYERYRTGETAVLCNADILIRSFDEPKAEVCLNLRPTLSKVVAEQRAGRVLRIDPNNPDKHAYIVDFVDKNQTSKNPILFSEIVGAGEVNSVVSETKTNSQKRKEPAPLPQIEIEGLTVHTNAQEVMVVTKNLLDKDVWITPKAMAIELGYDKSFVMNLLSRLQETYPHFIRPASGKKGRFLINSSSRTFFEQIRSQFKAPPEGWTSAHALAQELKVGPRALNKMIARLTESKPQLKGQYRSPSGKVGTHISPDIKDEIVRTVKGTTILPNGWLKVGEASRILGHSEATIKKYAQGIDESGTFYNEHRQTIFGLSLEALVEVERRILATNFTYAPEGWLSANELAVLLDATKLSILSLAEKNRYAEIGLAGLHRNEEFNLAYYFSPEILDEIEQKLKEERPEGTMTVKELAKETGFDSGYISRYANENFSDDIQFLSIQGQRRRMFVGASVIEHFRKQKELHKEPENELWKNVNQIVDALGLDAKTVRRYFVTSKQENPESVKYFHFNGKPTMFLSPEAFLALKQSEQKKVKNMENITNTRSENLDSEFVPFALYTSRFSSVSYVQRMINRLIADNDPEVKKVLVPGRSKPAIFATKAKIKKLIEEQELQAEAARGRLALSELLPDIRISTTFLQGLIARKEREGDPRIIRHNRSFLISEDLAAEIKALYPKVEAREGFITLQQAAAQSGVQLDALRRRVGSLSKTNDSSVIVEGKGNSSVVLIDENQLDHVTEGLTKAPEGYLTIAQLCQMYGLPRSRVQPLVINSYKEKRKGFFKGVIEGKKKWQYLATDEDFKKVLDHHMERFIPEGYIDINSLAAFEMGDREKRNEILRVMINSDHRILKTLSHSGHQTYAIRQDAADEIVKAIKAQMS